MSEIIKSKVCDSFVFINPEYAKKIASKFKKSGIFDNAAFFGDDDIKEVKSIDFTVADIIYCNFELGPCISDCLLTTKTVNGCTVTITFSTTKNPDLKEKILWHLTGCYEKRIESESKELFMEAKSEKS